MNTLTLRRTFQRRRITLFCPGYLFVKLGLRTNTQKHTATGYESPYNY
jgi:hypothetical protein